MKRLNNKSYTIRNDHGSGSDDNRIINNIYPRFELWKTLAKTVPLPYGSTAIHRRLFVPPAPPPIDGNLARNQHGIEVLSSPPLERLGSPFPDEDHRVTKKHWRGNSTTGERSYASAVTSQLKQTTDVVSLHAMDEVVVLDGECIVDINGQYPVIQFVDQVHDRIDYSMRRSVIVRLLGRAIGFKTLLNWIGLYSCLDGRAVDDFRMLSNGSTMESYIHHIRKHPSQVIYWVRLLGLPYRYYSKAIFCRIAMVIGQVVKIDYSTNSGERGRFARLAVLVNLNKPLIPCLKIDRFWEKIEYEGLQQICFQCGVYRHSKDVCGSIEANTSKGGAASGSSFDLDKGLGCEELGFGPWMIAETRRRRTKKNLDSNMKTSGDDTRGSRFAILGEGNDGIDEDSTVIPEVAVDVTNMEEGLANTSRIDSRVKGKGRSRKTEAIQTLQQINVIAMKDGVIPQVTEHRNDRVVGNHSVVTILEDSRLHVASKNIRNKGNKRENKREEGNRPVVEALEAVTEEGAGCPSFRRYLREYCREHRPRIIVLLETQISGNVSEKAIRTFGFQNSFRVEALGFTGGGNEAWVLGGDFNSIIRLDERDGGSCRGSRVRNLFAAFVFELGLFEVDYRGPKFMWRRGNLCKRLDRCLMNSCWANVFSGTMVLHLDRVGSDHCPLLLKAQNTTRVQGNQPFRFIAAWQDHPQFKSFLSEEVVHSMRLKKGKIGYMAIKIDLGKTYDRLEWPFIDDTAMSASFNPSRGLRQGDPLSPYLFVMCMERLGHAITGAVNNGRWKPIRLCRNGLVLSHLFFANELVLLAEASIEQCDVIRGILELFCKSSGQKINMQKTTIYYSKNVDLDLKNSISASFGFQEVQNLGKYLGVPLLHSQITKASYSYIVSRVRDKLTGWKEKSLSLAGRITLAKTVLSVIPSYSMQSTMLPKGICEEIERLIRGFIWGRTENRGGVPLVHWENICKPTVNSGLGLRKLSVQNEAFLMKLVYKLVVNSDQLWARVLRSKYKWVELIPESINRTRSSHVWKGISQVWNEVRQSFVWNIGNGCNVDFWRGYWLCDLGPLASFVVNIAERDNLPRKSVSSMVDHNGQWRWEFIIDKLLNTIVQRLAATMPHDKAVEWMLWTGESSDHLFRQCYMAMAIWSTLVKTEKLEEFCTRDIRSWMQINIASPGFYAREENDWDLRFSSILWLIWKNRNSRIFDPDYFEHESVLEMSRRLTLEANRAMESSLSTIQLSHRSCTMPDVWQPPPHNWCKINTDGSRDIGSGFASLEVFFDLRMVVGCLVSQK
ncbi:hypothetical protein F3Y22_tig00111634pilonHSYRG00065 [Hibiscus syriacus]|uniref:Reverse transcriptase domain-containing protein n=1 Tax=Hibiscus syriacus TaxID=106335 RepID=A0A6A2YG94_HIBSY|nr:hypothetical protein F3Y22_tig00111634pilonHSYRG00065 [Hibiscus syriacus]